MSTLYEGICSVDGRSWRALGVNKKELTDEEFENLIQQNKLQNLEKIKSMISSGVHTFVNDHNGLEEELQAVVILDNNHICAVGINNIWCLNKLYVGKDERIHLSTVTVAGRFGYCDSQTDGDKKSFMAGAMEYYNKAKNSYKIITYIII